MAEKLRLTIDKLDDVPEGQRDLYEEREGKFYLTVEDAVPRGRLDEFRANNIKLLKEIDEIKKQYGGMTAEQLKELKESHDILMAEKEKQKEDELVKDKNIEELKAEWTKKLVKERDKGFAERDQEITALKGQLRKLQITNQLTQAAVSAKLNDWAVKDAVRLGEMEFDLDEKGNPVAYDLQGGTRTMRYGKDGEPLTIAEWLGEQVAARPGWLPASTGGGGQHQNGPGARGSSKKRRSEMSTAEKSAYISEHGQEGYLALPY